MAVPVMSVSQGVPLWLLWSAALRSDRGGGRCWRGAWGRALPRDLRLWYRHCPREVDGIQIFEKVELRSGPGRLVKAYKLTKPVSIKFSTWVSTSGTRAWKVKLEEVSEAQSKCKSSLGLVPGSKILGKQGLDRIVFSNFLPVYEQASNFGRWDWTHRRQWEGAPT